MNTLSEYEVWLRDEYRPIRGGQGEPGEGGEERGEEPVVGEGGEKPVFKDLIDGKPIERWNDVYGKYKTTHEKYQQYAEFGDPGEVKSKLQKLQEWEKAVEEQRRKSSMTDDDRTAEQNQQRIRQELLKVYPELKDIQTLKELREEISDLKGEMSGSKLESVANKASGELSGMLSAAKIDSKYQSKIEDLIFSQMTQEEQRQFAMGDFSRMKEIFEQELNEGLLSAHKRSPAPPNPMVRHKPGGTPPRAKDAKPKTLDDASNDAWPKMNG